ncbi:unnamed protein product [Paramecium sonneborni]|uniref:Uncharacterized protein n=1 Tax=Paramecium sonneborni TaxID=65129 RepID=A0A8S1JXV0_9CILI|nr:unnamed protein product [Paramecium sonneborni]
MDKLVDEVNNKFIAVDCIVNPDVKIRFGVKGYFTLLYVKDNKTYKFQGQRNPDLLIKFNQEDYSDAKEISDIPKFELYNENLIDKYFAVILLSLLIFVVIILCGNDCKENRKLDKIEKELQEQMKEN